MLDEFRRVEVGFAGAAALLCGLLYLLYRRPRARPEDVVEPGSPQELEARLAAGGLKQLNRASDEVAVATCRPAGSGRRPNPAET